jgi:hypothetical protein
MDCVLGFPSLKRVDGAGKDSIFWILNEPLRDFCKTPTTNKNPEFRIVVMCLWTFCFDSINGI